MSALRQTAKVVLGRLLPAELLLLKGDASRTSASRAGRDVIPISLTFDDGPHPDWTRPVLDALDEAEWKGTFFIIGREAAAYPHLLREIVDRGHEIGNHTYSHAEPAQTSVRGFLNEVQQTQMLLHELTGRNVSLVRPPLGRLSLGKAGAMWRSGQSVVLWNVDPKDFAMSGRDAVEAWASGYRPTGGDVVLLHDRLPSSAQIVRRLAQFHGDLLTSVPVSEWLTAKPNRPLTSCLRAAGGLFA